MESILDEVPPETIHPPKLVTGTDLIALGLEPGPKFGEILEAVETGQLEGRVTTDREALHFVGGYLTAESSTAPAGS